MDKRFLAIWTTVSIGGACTVSGTNRPLEMSVFWAVMGLVCASVDKLARKKTN